MVLGGGGLCGRAKVGYGGLWLVVVQRCIMVLVVAEWLVVCGWRSPCQLGTGADEDSHLSSFDNMDIDLTLLHHSLHQVKLLYLIYDGI
eukprot:6455803-Amphidinium_carterae.1